MLNVIITIIGVTLANSILGLIVYRRYLPGLIQDVLNDVGESFSESLTEAFETPNMKKAMSIIGGKSGDSRSIKAVQNKLALATVGQINPMLKIVFDKLGFNIEEMIEEYGAEAVVKGVETFMPIIKNLTQGMQR